MQQGGRLSNEHLTISAGARHEEAMATTAAGTSVLGTTTAEAEMMTATNGAAVEAVPAGFRLFDTLSVYCTQ